MMYTARWTKFNRIGAERVLSLPVTGFVIENVEDLALVRNYTKSHRLIYHNLHHSQPSFTTRDLVSSLELIAYLAPDLQALTLFNEIVLNNNSGLVKLNFDLAEVVRDARRLFPYTDLLIGDYRLIDLFKCNLLRSVADEYGLGIWLQVQHSVDCFTKDVVYYAYLGCYRWLTNRYRTYCSEVSFWGDSKWEHLKQFMEYMEGRTMSFGPWTTDTKYNYSNLATKPGEVNVSWLRYGKPTELVEWIGTTTNS